LIEAALRGVLGVLLTFDLVEPALTALGIVDAVFKVDALVVVERLVLNFVVVALVVVILLELDLVDDESGLLLLTLEVVDEAVVVTTMAEAVVEEMLDAIDDPDWDDGKESVVEDDEVVVDVETAALAVVAELGRGGATSPIARFTYVLIFQPAPQNSSLLPLQVILHCAFAVIGPLIVIPVKH
jgi:hypothetical protein